MVIMEQHILVINVAPTLLRVNYLIFYSASEHSGDVKLYSLKKNIFFSLSINAYLKSFSQYLPLSISFPSHLPPSQYFSIHSSFNISLSQYPLPSINIFLFQYLNISLSQYPSLNFPLSISFSFNIPLSVKIGIRGKR